MPVIITEHYTCDVLHCSSTVEGIATSASATVNFAGNLTRMDYSTNISEHFEISYVDLLERIERKFKKDEFLCKHLKKIRTSKETQIAKAANVPSLMKIFYNALDMMAAEADPCIEILDRSGKAKPNNTVRLVKLPLVQGQGAVRKLSKEALMLEVANLRRHNNELTARVKQLEQETKHEQQLKESFMAKAGALQLEEDSYDKHPACYEGTDYSAYLAPHRSENGSRPRFGATDYSFKMEKEMPFIATWIIAERKALVEKQPAHTRARADEGIVSKKASDRGCGARTAVSQFFKFVAITHGLDHKTFMPKEEHLLSSITVGAFLEFYSQHAGSPNSAGNKAKFLVSLFKYMLTIERFYHYGPRINSIIAKLHKYIMHMKAQYETHHSQHCLSINLMLKGQWLESAELSYLNKYISKEIVKFLESSEEREPSKLAIYRFQETLIVFALLQTGGQRREVFINFAIDNFALIDGQLVHFTLDEKVQKRRTDRLTLPETLGDIIRIWIDKFRLRLVEEDSDVLSFFVSKDGKPLKPRRLTEFVKRKIAQVFPGRVITPVTIRRIMVTEMAIAMLDRPKEYFAWAAKHAALINTSPPVLMKNYNRCSQNKQSAESLKTINTTLSLEPSAKIKNTINKHAKRAKYLTEEGQEIEEVVDMRYHNNIRQYEVKLKDGKTVWKNYMNLSGAVELVIKFLMKKAKDHKKNNPLLPALSEEEEFEYECCGDECHCEGDSEENVEIDSSSESTEDNDEMPDLATGSEEENELMSLEDTHTEPKSVVSTSHNNSNVASLEVVVAMDKQKKRKRFSDIVGPQKRVKVTCENTEVLLDGRALKPGDVVSVNPDSSADEFWLAEVLKVSSKSRVAINWLEKTQQDMEYCKGARTFRVRDPPVPSLDADPRY